MSKKGIRKKHFSIVFRCKLVGSISKESGDLMGQEVLKDRNGKQIKKGDWIRYVFGEGDEVGGLKVVSQGGELGIIQSDFFFEDGWKHTFVNLKETDLPHCILPKEIQTLERSHRIQTTLSKQHTDN